MPGTAWLWNVNFHFACPVRTGFVAEIWKQTNKKLVIKTVIKVQEPNNMLQTLIVVRQQTDSMKYWCQSLSEFISYVNLTCASSGFTEIRFSLIECNFLLQGQINMDLSGAEASSSFQPKEEIITVLQTLGFSRNAAIKVRANILYFHVLFLCHLLLSRTCFIMLSAE